MYETTARHHSIDYYVYHLSYDLTVQNHLQWWKIVVHQMVSIKDWDFAILWIFLWIMQQHKQTLQTYIWLKKKKEKEEHNKHKHPFNNTSCDEKSSKC